MCGGHESSPELMFVDGITRSVSPTANIYHGFCSVGGACRSRFSGLAPVMDGRAGHGHVHGREDLIDVDTHPPPLREGTNSINQTLRKRHTCERGVPAHAHRLARHFFSLRALTDSVKKRTKRNSLGRPEAAMPAITIFLYLCKIRKQGSGERRLCQTANHWKKSLDSVRNSLPLWGSC